MKILIPIITVIFISCVILFRGYLSKNKIPMDLIVTILLVSLTAYYVIYTKSLTKNSREQIDNQREQFIKQTNFQNKQFQEELKIQTDQFIINSRPNVFISDWGEFKKYEKYQTIQFKLENVANKL